MSPILAEVYRRDKGRCLVCDQPGHVIRLIRDAPGIEGLATACDECADRMPVASALT